MSDLTDADALAESWLETMARLNPATAIRLGRPSSGFADYSPDGIEAVVAAARDVRTRVASLAPGSWDDEITARELDRESSQVIDEHAAGLLVGELNVIASPAQEIRNSFDLMPRDDEHDWKQMSDQLAAVRGALDGYRAALDTRPRIPLRQLVAVAHQARQTSEQFFGAIGDDPRIPESLRSDVARHAAAAADAYLDLATYLTEDAVNRSTTRDDVGSDRYAIASRRFLGMQIDVDENYTWARQLLARLTDEQRAVALEICGERSIAAAVAALERDPEMRLHGTEALRAWLQEASDEAVAALSGTHFDIPPVLQRLHCRIAPAADAGIYYTEPSLDGLRAGTMWWSVPTGVDMFRKWREKTTVYHEGVPGHHLQMGGAMLDENLNVWRRSFAGSSGHREGWGLYAEHLMAELGFLDDPRERFGMLDAQRMRAARVVLDIGLHTGRTMPGSEGMWTAGRAFEFLRRNTVMSEPALRYEVLRYLGWPGQASSYSIGQRVWDEARAKFTSERPGGLKEFHRRALSLGGLGLSTFVWAMHNAPQESGA